MVGHRLLVPSMGVRILLPEHFLIQVNKHLVADKSQNRGDLFRFNPKRPQTNGNPANEAKIFLRPV